MITAAIDRVSEYYLSISTASVAHARNWDAKLPTTDHESQRWLVSVRYTRYLCPCKILRRISVFWTLPDYVHMVDSDFTRYGPSDVLTGGLGVYDDDMDIGWY